MITLTPDQLFQTALSNFNTQQWAQSLTALQQYILHCERDPNYKERAYIAKIRVVHCLIETNQPRQALSTIAQMQDHYPNDSNIIKLKGFIYWRQACYRIAFLHFIKTFKHNPKDEESLKNALLCLSSLKRFLLFRRTLAYFIAKGHRLSIQSFWQLLKDQGQGETFANDLIKIADQQSIRLSSSVYHGEVMLALSLYDSAKKMLTTLEARHSDQKIVLILFAFMVHIETNTFALAEENMQILNSMDENALPQTIKIKFFRYRYRFFLKQNKTDKFLAAIEKFLTIAPADPNAIHDLSTFYASQLQYGKGLALYEHSMRLNPKSAETYASVIYSLSHCRLYGWARYVCEAGKKIDPNLVSLKRNESINLLAADHYKEGFEAFDIRWKLESDGNAQAISTRKLLPFPVLTDLQLLEGKSLIIHFEQGLGDGIHFLRYAPLIKPIARQLSVIFNQAYEALKPLCEALGIFDEIVVIKPQQQGISIRRYDYQCSIMDFPLLFKTTLETVPPPVPFIIDNQLKTEQRKKIDQIARYSIPKIGFVYEGGTDNPANQRRSLRLQGFLPVLQQFHDKIDFFCLQKDINDEDRQEMAKIPNLSLWDHTLNSFIDTALLIDQMDLLISVDTAVAHLGATQGKPTWLMVTWRNDWRWGLIRRHSPWYEQIRLYRQPFLGNWQGMIDLVQADLRDWLYHY